jgi:hypothetical protein
MMTNDHDPRLKILLSLHMLVGFRQEFGRLCKKKPKKHTYRVVNRLLAAEYISMNHSNTWFLLWNLAIMTSSEVHNLYILQDRPSHQFGHCITHALICTHTHTHTTGPMLGTHSHHILQALASQSNQSCYYNHYEYPKWANNGDNNAAKSMTRPLVFLCQCVTRRCPYLPYESSGHGSTVILMGNINVNL